MLDSSTDVSLCKTWLSQHGQWLDLFQDNRLSTIRMSGDMCEAASHSPVSSEMLYLFSAHIKLISQNLVSVLS